MISSRPQKRLEDLAKDHRLTLVSVLLGILASIATIITLFLSAPANDPGGSTPSATLQSGSSSTAGSSSTSPDTQVQPSAAKDSAAPDCLDDALRPVACALDHRYEVVSGPCTIRSAVRYLGGAPGTDVPYSDPRQQKPGCLLEAPLNIRGASRGAFTRSGSDRWRRCFDRSQQRVVPCSTNHTGEYIAAGPADDGSERECDTAASDYMDQSLANVDEDLEVRGIERTSSQEDQDEARCLIQIRGRQQLTKSVRHLGVQPVPLQES